MARPCSVCTRPDRAEIDAALVAPGSFRAVSRRFAVGSDALERHHKAHVPAALAKAQEASELTDADSLAAEVRKLKADARRLGAKAEKKGDLRTALAAIKVLSDLVSLLEATRKEEGPQRIIVSYADDWRNPNEIETQREREEVS